MTIKSNSDSDIFRAAAGLAPDQQAAFLDEACRGNRHLREEVESLLRAHDPEGSFLRSPVVAVTVDRPVNERPGSIIGPYKLREQIGEGGFGVVYVAEQEKPIRRKVALKIIKPGMDTKDVIARFEAERQALALMDHPNVARVLDAGATENGRPYFVMELVQGVTITEFCDRNNLPTRDRLALFADACRAVQHAHQKGIIHRDLKPSNIMVTLHDGKPVAKVIDFGVSKALSQRLTEKSIYTAYGQMIGTPAYMSPEQAEMSGLGIDTRSDIYSLGVLLYELLTGQTPLDARRLRASAYAEILRIIREEEPPRPSLKISTLGDQATVIAQQRHTDVKQLRNDLAGELDWIVMKCLEKDRSRRYETASGLARDIERFLRDEPVEACPPSTAYRLSKMARKHRSLIGIASVFLVLLIAGAAISSWLAVRATLAERRAQAAQADALAALQNEQMARREAMAAKEKVEWASKRLSTATQLANDGVEFYYRENRTAALEKFAEAAEAEPNLNTIYVYRRMLYTDIGLWDLAAADYAQTFHLTTRHHWQSCFEHAMLRHYIGDETGYNAACQEFLRQYGKSTGSDVQMRLLYACCVSAKPVLPQADLARRAESLAAASDKGWHRSAAAMAFLRAGNYARAIEICDNIAVPGASSPGGVHRLNYAIKAMALHALGRNQEAQEALARLEVAIDEWTKEMFDGPVGTMPISWYDWLYGLLHYREARTLVTGSPPPQDPRLLTVRQRALEITQGDVHSFMQAGREAAQRAAWDEAAASFATAIEKMPLVVRNGPKFMRLFVEIVQQPEVFQRLVDIQPDNVTLWLARGHSFASRREWSRAANDCAKAVEVLGETESVRSGAFAIASLANLRLLVGDLAGYRELRSTIIDQADGIDDPHAANSLSRALSLGPVADAHDTVTIRLAEQALAANPKTAWYLFGVGAAHYRAGNYEEAIARLEESLKLHPAWLGRGQNYVVLAMACHQLGRQEEARIWLSKANPSPDEIEQTIGVDKYALAASPYLSDWLALQVLLPEAESLLARQSKP